MKDKLTPKQRPFVIAYEDYSNKTTYHNGRESARAAGCKGNNKSLDATASRMLTYDKVKVAIAEIQADRACRTEYNQAYARRLLEEQLIKANTANDRTNAIAAIRELNTIYALRTENINQTITDEQRKLTEAEELEAKRLAQIRLHEA